MSAIGFKTELSEDRTVAVGYSKKDKAFVMEFTTPINDFSRTPDAIIRKHREVTVEMIGDRVMATRVKLSEEAFIHLMRLSDSVLSCIPD